MPIGLIMLGDIVGRVGCLAVAQAIPQLQAGYRPDLILANAENAADGSGLTRELYKQLIAAGLHGLTLGDHVYKKAQIFPVFETAENLIRPANLPGKAKGLRWMALQSPTMSRPVHVVTLLGRVHATLPVDEPCAVIDRLLKELPDKAILLVEIHAEATAEKQAIGRYLDGRASLVVGTHTHVPTADARVLPKGTGYITDLGMCGPYESVIGRRIDRVLTHMTTGMPAPFDVATGDLRVCGVSARIDEATGRCLDIQRVEIPVESPGSLLNHDATGADSATQ